VTGAAYGHARARKPRKGLAGRPGPRRAAPMHAGRHGQRIGRRDRLQCGLAADLYFFSTFQRKVTGDTITPDKLVRNAVGMMNCAVGM
jgi:hypothetical protein